MAAFRDRLSYARSLCITAPLVFLVTGVMGSVSLATSLFDSTGRLQHTCARLWARMILVVCGVRLRISGADELRDSLTYVFFANHASHIDIPIILAALPVSFRFAAKKELFRIPFLGWHLRRSGHISVDRRNPHASVKLFRGASARLRKGTSLVFFPEGGTSPDGSVKPFKGGGFILAEQFHAKVVPVTIRGSRDVLLPRLYNVMCGRVEVTLGKPMSTDGCTLRELTARVREEIITVFENDKTLDRNTHSISR